MNATTKTLLAGAGLVGLLFFGARTWIEPRDREAPGPLAPQSETLLAEPQGHAQAKGKERMALGEPAAAPEPKQEEQALALPDDPLPAGELHVLVLASGKPANEGQAYVYNGNVNGLATNFRKEGRGSFRAALDGEGWARFRGLSPRVMFVGAEIEAGFTQHVKVRMPAEHGLRVVLELGPGSLTGRVFDDYGMPVLEARVTAVHAADGTLGIGWTDVQGRYELRGMRAGDYSVTVRRTGSWNNHSSSEVRDLALAEGEAARLDFGRSEALPRLGGAVRNPAGDVVSGAGWGGLRSYLILREPSGGITFRLQCEADGTYDLGLRPGTYGVTLELAGVAGKVPLEVPLSMPERNLDQDLVLPGGVLRGVFRADGVPIDGAAHRYTVGLYDPDGRGPSMYSTILNEQGRFTLSGVKPGTYEVKAYPREVAEGTLVTFQEGDQDRVLDLTAE